MIIVENNKTNYELYKNYILIITPLELKVFESIEELDEYLINLQ